MATVEHLAGRLVEGVQKCLRCDAVLTDYRTAEVRTDAPASYLAGWAEGARVAVAGRSMWVVDSLKSGPSGSLCREVRRG